MGSVAYCVPPCVRLESCGFLIVLSPHARSRDDPDRADPVDSDTDSAYGQSPDHQRESLCALFFCSTAKRGVCPITHGTLTRTTRTTNADLAHAIRKENQHEACRTMGGDGDRAIHHREARIYRGRYAGNRRRLACDEVILSDCSPTGVPVRTIVDMKMFIHGGQLIETSGTPGVGAPPLQRGSPGLGTWQHLGQRHYSAVFRFFRFDGSDDTFVGIQVVYQDIKLSKDGNAFTYTGTTNIFDATGTLITTRCTTGTATRLE